MFDSIQKKDIVFILIIYTFVKIIIIFNFWDWIGHFKAMSHFELNIKSFNKENEIKHVKF